MTNRIKPILVLAIVLLHPVNDGQAQFLPLNRSGKCEVADIMVAEGFSKGALYANEVRWLKGFARNEGKLNFVVKDSTTGKVSGNVEYLVYAQSGILRKIAGAISYHFSLETKDEKYRYSFNDFIYHYYVQDRNYRMVKTGNTKPLEETEAVGWQKLWTDHRKTVSTLVSHQVEELKIRMIEKPGKVNDKKKEKKVDW